MVFDFVDVVDRLKADRVEFCLSPTQWQQSKAPSNLSWDRVSFKKSEAADVPRARGVYAFIVELYKKGLPSHGYIMYVGETGHTSNETLRSRFLSYFGERQKQLRAIHYALLKYEKYLYFHFSEVTDRNRSLKELEQVLLDTFIPPYNMRDFSIEISRARKAF